MASTSFLSFFDFLAFLGAASTVLVAVAEVDATGTGSSSFHEGPFFVRGCITCRNSSSSSLRPPFFAPGSAALFDFFVVLL